jgi:hypothetical protein
MLFILYLVLDLSVLHQHLILALPTPFLILIGMLSLLYAIVHAAWRHLDAIVNVGCSEDGKHLACREEAGHIVTVIVVPCAKEAGHVIATVIVLCV